LRRWRWPWPSEWRRVLRFPPETEVGAGTRGCALPYPKYKRKYRFLGAFTYRENTLPSGLNVCLTYVSTVRRCFSFCKFRYSTNRVYENIQEIKCGRILHFPCKYIVRTLLPHQHTKKNRREYISEYFRQKQIQIS
jgi:hypothetical protein